jgi:hypothetical protein
LLERGMQTRAHAAPHDFVHAVLGPAAGGTAVVVAVDARSPDRARAVADALAIELIAASGRTVAGWTRTALRDARAQLRVNGLSRRKLRQRRRDLRVLRNIAHKPPVPATHGTPVLRPSMSWADRLADSLGADSSHPSPLIAGLAGALVGLALWGTSLALITRPLEQRPS